MAGEERDGMQTLSSRVFLCNAGDKKQICQHSQASQQVVMKAGRMVEERGHTFSSRVFLCNADDTW